MARPRKAEPSRHYKLTLDAADAAVLDSYAEHLGKRPATVAAILLREAVQRASGAAEGDELSEARRHIAELEAERDGLRRQIQQPRSGGVPDAPRYEWPMIDLLADDDWWDRHLPRLYELLGRAMPGARASQYGEPPEAIVDSRGYLDLLTLLFPPLQRGDRVVVTWRSVDYVAIATGQAQPKATGSAALADAWEPVIRHVAEALCALERTGEPGADPYLRLRAEDELSGPWLRILLQLIGQRSPEDLPRHAVGAARTSLRTQLPA
jgi:hypothetical protein